MVACVQLLVRKFQEHLPTAWAYLIKLFLFPLSVCLSVVCACIEVWPSHTTNAEPVSPLATSVEAPIFALHLPLPASKTVLSSWSLLVTCPLIAPGVTGITGWYDNRLVVPEVPGTTYESTTAYMYDNIGYISARASPVCYVLVSCMYECSYFHTWCQVLLLLYDVR